MSTLLKKPLKSSYPACDVQQRQEPIVIDTVYSDTPAIDNSFKLAQIFIGTESLVTNIFRWKQKEHFNTLQDIIKTHDAPTKLIRDHAQVEISNKVHDILSYLSIKV